MVTAKGFAMQLKCITCRNAWGRIIQIKWRGRRIVFAACGGRNAMYAVLKKFLFCFPNGVKRFGTVLQLRKTYLNTDRWRLGFAFFVRTRKAEKSYAGSTIFEQL